MFLKRHLEVNKDIDLGHQDKRPRGGFPSLHDENINNIDDLQAEALHLMQWMLQYDKDDSPLKSALHVLEYSSMDDVIINVPMGSTSLTLHQITCRHIAKILIYLRKYNDLELGSNVEEVTKAQNIMKIIQQAITIVKRAHELLYNSGKSSFLLYLKIHPEKNSKSISHVHLFS
jgi:hypothetical protein